MIENPISWPDNARCAVSFTFDMDAESILHLNYPDTSHEEIFLSSLLRFGPEIAIPRLVRIFERVGLQQSFYVPGWCVENYPAAVELLVKHGHEIGHHGYLHESTNKLSREEELDVLHRGIECIKRVTGRAPAGYRSPSAKFSKHTLDLLVDADFLYDSSLAGDDMPHLLKGKSGSLIELAYEPSSDDWSQFGYNTAGLADVRPATILPPQESFAVFRADFDTAWEWGGMWIVTFHPFLVGRMARCRALIELIEYVLSKGRVWVTSLEMIARHVRACMEDGSWSARVDQLPYYEAPPNPRRF